MMKKTKKKRTATKVASGAIIGVMLFGTGVFAATQLLNWTGGQTMSETGTFLDQITNKLIKSEKEKNDAIADKGQLEDQIKDLEDQIANGGGNNGDWTEKDQEIIDLNNQLIQKDNELIAKQNDIERLTEELQKANSAATVIQTKLDDAKSRLDAEGINIWN